MAPEQIRNARDIDARVDIWAFGVVAFECLVGVPPFDGKDVYELFERIQAGIHARANDLNPAVPKEFDTWFDIACAVDTTHRFANAAVAATHLAVALGENGDAETTGPGGWQHGDRASERSGARLKEHAALALAQTIEQTLAGKVLSRKRRTVGESASSLPLVRIAKDPAMETPAPARTATPEPAARVSPVVPASRPSTRGARWIMIACAGLAGGATAFWLRPFLPHRTPTSVASPSVWTPEPPVAAALVHPTSISAPSAPADPLPAPATTGPPSAPPVHPSASPLRASPAPKMPAALAPQTAPAPPAASASVTASPQPSQAPPSRPSSSPFQLPPLAF
jgi:serine/threonine-protein kinase